MSYMVHQRFASAILDAYRDDPEVARQVEAAESARRWLEALAIDPRLRAALVEPIAVVEEALRTLARRTR